jgi:hypothetical protein
VVRPKGPRGPNEGSLYVKAREETIDRTGGACAPCNALMPDLWRAEK